MYRVVSISRGPASAQQITPNGALLDLAPPSSGGAAAPSARDVTSPNRRKKGKSPRGLGRGLAGILEVKPAATKPDRTGALSLLLGAEDAVVSGGVDVINKIHRFVIDAAVAAMVDGFNAEGAVVASQSIANADGHDEALPNLSLRVPPSCSVSSPLLFSMYGQLSQLLDADCSSQDVDGEQRQLGNTWVWMYRVDGGDLDGESVTEDRSQATVAATFRATPFEQWETDALSSLVASVAFTLGPNKKQVELRRKLKADTTVTLTRCSGNQCSGNQCSGIQSTAPLASLTHAEVRFGGPVGGSEPGPDGFVSGSGVAADQLTAVAEAAVSICQSNHEVVFAGSSEVGRHSVTIVMLTEAGTRPRLGVAVHEPGELAGVVEAVLTAITR